ncbi:MAG: response regulator [Methanomicrobiaceae archaeon]|nr:response regulator [Methanomicrobiaceae archaeon]MDD5418764.1 response regulator [Methanomicrobiaceae archaeon]
MNETADYPHTPRSAEILLVEDSTADIALIQEALLESKLLNNLHVVTDGEEAMAFLRNEGRHASAPRPDLILLDLNLPRKNGREVLTEIKQDASLSIIPVVILTVSEDEKDIFESYRLHANCYIKKPVQFADFIKIVQSIENYWFTIVTLPHRPGI